MNIYQGDPAIKLTPNGADLTFLGGQPVLDGGVENEATISLFTAEGWPGNFLLEPDARIGSNFEATAAQANTVSKLALTEKAAEESLNSEVFGPRRAVATNPESHQTRVIINVEPPGENEQQILLTRNGQNWINQAVDPAHRRY